MPIVPGDWSVDRPTGNIRYTGDGHGGASPSYATAIEFHRWLEDLADDAEFTGDDELDIVDETPSDRSTDNIVSLINGFNVDQTAMEHIYDGSVSQNGGDDVWIGLVVVGSVPDGTTLQIIKNNTFEDDATAPYWGATSSGIALNGDAAANILTRICIQTRSGGADIDGQRLRVQARELGDTYAEFSLTAGLGNNTAAIFTAADLNNQTAEATIAALSITNNTEGYIGLDVNGNAIDEFYYSDWRLNGDEINDLYEYGKWIQSRDATQAAAQSTFYGLDGMLFRGITHEIDIDTPTGTFNAVEPVSWAGGTGQMLAIDSVTAGTKMYIQLLTGTIPADGVTITGGTSSATADVNVNVTARTISAAFMGASTGSSIIGSYGLGILPADLTASDQLFDLTNTLQVPPNNVTFAVNGVVVGEDRILVGPEDGAGGLDLDQMSLNATLSGAAVTSIVMASAIPTDTPSAGTIRVQTDSGLYRRIVYTSYTGSTFTVASTDFSADNAAAANNAFVSYIDKLAAATSETFTSVFDATRTLFIRVRDGAGTPIKTFETTGTLGSGGGSSTVIRTSDA